MEGVILLEKPMIKHVKLGEWSHYIDIYKYLKNGEARIFRLKAYDSKLTRSPENAKIILDHLTTALDFPTLKQT